MPRPKRSKIATSVPTRIAKTTREVIGEVDNTGGDAITVAPSIESSDANIIAAARRTSKSISRTIRLSPGQTAALSQSQKRRDLAMARLEAENYPSGDSGEQAISSSDQLSSSPSAEVGRREMATPTTGNSYLAQQVFKKRSHQPGTKSQINSAARSSSVESNLVDANGLTNLPRMKSSVLGTGNFGRQKQTPLHRRTTSRVRSSSVTLDVGGGSPGNINSAVRGMFKRRARQPSILGTAQKERKEPESYHSEVDFNEEDFNPEDESTPLKMSKAKSTTREGSQSTSSAINPRKRKLSSMHTPLPSSPLRSESQACESLPSARGSPSPLLEQPARPSTPEPMSETMAPPQSSSPVHVTPEAQPSVLLSRRQTNRRALSPPPIEDLPSSPPSLTHSPNGPAVAPLREPKTTWKPKPQPASFSTVELQALLPRRRHRSNPDLFDVSSDEREMDVSGLGSDEDELTHLTMRTSRTSRQSARPRRVARLKPGPKLKEKAAVESAKMTYGSRHRASSKENTPGPGHTWDPDDSLAPLADSILENSSDLEEKIGKELKLAKRKFEVVDKWELDFEEVTASSSSPWDAR